MKHADSTLAARRLGARSIAAAVALVLASASHGAPTDIASTPIITTTAALVKPNIMLLMDASGSMGRTHMPDEVEIATGPTSIGYKSSQCNALYYNPTQTYFLPKDSTGTPFTAPTFSSAPYAGFGTFYLPPDTHAPVDLRSQFVAYDNSTLETPVPPASLDTPQAAYYYVYTGTETLKYSLAPCTQDDTGGTIATPGGGLWTKVVVAAAEQQNFANWYAFYRTRLALIKSAASLAFSPLNDTKRVGFITVQPKDTPTSSGINPIRFLPVGDFNSVQKGKWFQKLFQQAAGGASPAREGLARVGRYYGGQQDGINTDMPATGADDPIQYSCQQNFTIMTTDGYWNGQTETPGPFGGGVNLPGTAKVGQQDGTLSDPWSPRPIWDGTSSGNRVDTDKTNAYTDNVCSLSAGRFKSTFQATKRTFVVQSDSVRYPRHTVQNRSSSVQYEAQTTQTTKTVTQNPQTTVQYALEHHHFTEERYKVIKWQEQTTQVMDQYQLQTIQTVAQTNQTRKVVSQTTSTAEQWTSATSQFVVSVTQYKLGKDQYRLNVQQVFIERWRIIKHVGGDEVGVASDDDCVNIPGVVVCERRVMLSSRLIDPDSCSPGTSSDGFFVHTTCTPGPLNQADRAVMSCSPSVVHSGGPDFTKTTCARVVVDPQVAINGTCTSGVTQGGAPDYFIFTCDLPAANNTSTPVSSCAPSSVSSGTPDFITTTCSQPVATNQPTANSPACTPGSTTDGLLITTTCVKRPDVVGPSDSCVNDPGTAPPYLKVTCSAPVASFDQYVPSASCSAGSTGSPDYNVTTCTTLPAGPYATATPVDTCTSGATSGSPDFFETTCTNPAGVNNQTVFATAAQCSVPSDTGAPWVTRICTKPFNNATSFADPSLCIADPGTSYPYLKVTCTPGDTVPPFPPTPVDSRLECGTFGTTVGPAGGGYVVTHCDKEEVSVPSPSSTCVPGVGPGPDFVVTVCGDVTFDVPVSFCNVGDTSVDGIDTVVCVKPPGANNTTVNIAGACVDTPASDPSWVTISCPPPIVTVTIVDPLTCPTGTTVGPGPAVLVTNCSAPAAVAPYASWMHVPSCTNNWDGTVRTTCRQPVATNFAIRDSAPCTTNTDGNDVTTTCSQVITDDYPVTCSTVSQTGTGPDVSCGAPEVTTGAAVASCAVGVSGTATDATTTTACNTVGDTGVVDYAGICSAPPVTGPAFVQTQCGERTDLVHVADSGCVDSPNTGSGIRTVCVDDVGGPGHKYSVAVTTTVTTTPYSGSVPSGPPVVVPTTGSTTLVDGICYPTAQALPPKPPVDIGGCSVWPCTTMTSGGTGSENSLADVAQYYYKTDLRPTMIDNVPSAGTGVEDDNAPHQHMTTFTIGLGVSGTLVYNPDYRSLATTTGDFADIRTGAKGWPLWPDPMLDYADFTNYNNPKSIDDFWHTAVDGRGRFFSANDPTSVVQGLGDALAKIDDVVASGTADSVSTLQPTSTNNFAYSTSYKSGVWQGDVESRTIDVSSGIPGPTVWSAKDLLGPRELATCDAREIRVLHGGATPTLTNFALGTNLCPTRVPPGTLTTTMDAVDQPFFGLASLSQLSQWALMSPAQQAAALADPGALVNFLRGQRASEGYVYNSATKFFRQRGEGIAGEGILGDIVDSQPVYVGEPFASYQENDYAGFKASRGAREPMIYVGANDGMLHAFYASLTATYGGQEAWAVIPSVLVPNLYKLADVNYKRDGHQFYVDGTPVVGDVWDGTNWRTILVGGLGAGGKGYYALDVTVPGVLPTPKWEFKLDLASCPAGSATAFAPNLYYGDCNLGLTFGKPVITKLAGQWVVMFTSGYNNGNGAATGDGVGFLYVVNALNGSLLYKIPTTGGTPGTPSGLAQINNYVDNVLLDNTTLRVYGGDVLGQMWRFDFLPSATATLLGTAKDLATATIEPITVRPELAELDGKPFVMFGTGKLLGSSDVTDSQKQSVYGLRDPLIGSSPIYPDPLRNSLKPMQVAQTGTGATAVRTISCTGSAGDCGRPAGFVLDLAEAGERVNVEMKLVLGALVFSSNVPEAVPCSVGGHSWFNQIDFSTGAPIPGAVTSQYLSDSINVGFNVLQLPPPPGSTNPQYVGLFRQSKATDLERQVTPPEPLPQGKRISWREIAQ